MTPAAVQRRTLRVLMLTQLLGGVGLAAGVAVGALLARDLLGGDALSGLPSAVATAGGAVAAVPISRLMARSGRRPGLAAGYLAGGTGAAIVLLAAQLRSFPLLVLGMLLFGVGNTASLLARYAAADLAEPQRRGRAVSSVLFATTFGAVAGPNLVEPAGTLARALSLPALAGPFLISVAAYSLAAAAVTVLLRPDPLLTARAAELTARAAEPAAPVAPVVGSAWALVLRGPALAGLVAMVGAQFVMVAMMTMTPVHMLAHNRTLGVIGFVISVHIAGMYALSPLGGLFCDRFGAPATIRLGGVILLAAGLGGSLATSATVALLTAALFLLGLGWSLSLVGGSTLLTAAVPLAQRAAAQGNADLLVGLAGATGGLGSGLVLALSGFAVLGLLTAAVAVGLLAAGARRRAVQVR
ncbi:MAG: MFS transporter [Actinomycetota bacterium]